MAVRGTNTMQEALQRMLQDVAQMKTIGDADLPWLTELETFILAKVREPIDMMQQNGQLPQPDPGMGMPPGMGGQPPTPAGAPMGGGMVAGAAPPNMNELQRMLGADQMS